METDFWSSGAEAEVSDLCRQFAAGEYKQRRRKLFAHDLEPRLKVGYRRSIVDRATKKTDYVSSTPVRCKGNHVTIVKDSEDVSPINLGDSKTAYNNLSRNVLLLDNGDLAASSEKLRDLRNSRERSSISSNVKLNREVPNTRRVNEILSYKDRTPSPTTNPTNAAKKKINESKNFPKERFNGIVSGGDCPLKDGNPTTTTDVPTSSKLLDGNKNSVTEQPPNGTLKTGRKTLNPQNLVVPSVIRSRTVRSYCRQSLLTPAVYEVYAPWRFEKSTLFSSVSAIPSEFSSSLDKCKKPRRVFYNTRKSKGPNVSSRDGNVALRQDNDRAPRNLRVELIDIAAAMRDYDMEEHDTLDEILRKAEGKSRANLRRSQKSKLESPPKSRIEDNIVNGILRKPKGNSRANISTSQKSRIEVDDEEEDNIVNGILRKPEGTSRANLSRSHKSRIESPPKSTIEDDDEEEDNIVNRILNKPENNSRANLSRSQKSRIESPPKSTIEDDDEEEDNIVNRISRKPEGNSRANISTSQKSRIEVDDEEEDNIVNGILRKPEGTSRANLSRSHKSRIESPPKSTIEDDDEEEDNIVNRILNKPENNSRANLSRSQKSRIESPPKSTIEDDDEEEDNIVNGILRKPENNSRANLSRSQKSRIKSPPKSTIEDDDEEEDNIVNRILNKPENNSRANLSRSQKSRIESPKSTIEDDDEEEDNIVNRISRKPEGNSRANISRSQKSKIESSPKSRIEEIDTVAAMQDDDEEDVFVNETRKKAKRKANANNISRSRKSKLKKKDGTFSSFRNIAGGEDNTPDGDNQQPTCISSQVDFNDETNDVLSSLPKRRRSKRREDSIEKSGSVANVRRSTRKRQPPAASARAFSCGFYVVEASGKNSRSRSDGKTKKPTFKKSSVLPSVREEEKNKDSETNRLSPTVEIECSLGLDNPIPEMSQETNDGNVSERPFADPLTFNRLNEDGWYDTIDSCDEEIVFYLKFAGWAKRKLKIPSTHCTMYTVVRGSIIVNVMGQDYLVKDVSRFKVHKGEDISITPISCGSKILIAYIRLPDCTVLH